MRLASQCRREGYPRQRTPPCQAAPAPPRVRGRPKGVVAAAPAVSRDPRIAMASATRRRQERRLHFPLLRPGRNRVGRCPAVQCARRLPRAMRDPHRRAPSETPLVDERMEAQSLAGSRAPVPPTTASTGPHSSPGQPAHSSRPTSAEAHALFLSRLGGELDAKGLRHHDGTSAFVEGDQQGPGRGQPLAGFGVGDEILEGHRSRTRIGK